MFYPFCGVVEGEACLHCWKTRALVCAFKRRLRALGVHCKMLRQSNCVWPRSILPQPPPFPWFWPPLHLSPA